MLKRVLDSLDGVESSMQNLYVEKDGQYYLQVEEAENDSSKNESAALKNLKRKKDIEAEHRRKAEAKLADLQAQHKALQEKHSGAAHGNSSEELSASESDLKNQESNEPTSQDSNNTSREAVAASLEKEFKAKLEQQKTEYEKHIASLQTSLKELLIDSNVQRMATELAVKGSSEALMPHIRQRLSVDVHEGKHVPVVLDAEGKPSALSLEELKTEIGSVAALAPLISGSKGSGGGASRSSGGASGKKFSELSEQERNSLYRTDPGRYRAARDAQITQ